jgi:hypothetical protein
VCFFLLWFCFFSEGNKWGRGRQVVEPSMELEEPEFDERDGPPTADDLPPESKLGLHRKLQENPEYIQLLKAVQEGNIDKESPEVRSMLLDLSAVMPKSFLKKLGIPPEDPV